VYSYEIHLSARPLGCKGVIGDGAGFAMFCARADG